MWKGARENLRSFERAGFYIALALIYFLTNDEFTPNQAILKGSKTLAQVRMAFIYPGCLGPPKPAVKVGVLPFSEAPLLRFNVRFIIYPFSRLLMWIVGVKLVVINAFFQHLIVSNHQGFRLGSTWPSVLAW